MMSMTRVEAIPMASMQAGMPWSWVTFPEFLDSVEAAPKAVNILPYMPISPLLIWVMGFGGQGGQAADRRAARRAEAVAARGHGCGRLRLVGPAHAADRTGGGTA